MKKLLLILLCLPFIGFAQTQKKSTFNFNKSNDYSKIYNYNNFKNENSEIKHNVCDSIIIINPDKQNKGEFMIDLRKVIKIYGSENTRWIYTYGDVANIPEGTIVKDGNEILPASEIYRYKTGSVSAFSNLFRFTMLYKKGGY